MNTLRFIVLAMSLGLAFSLNQPAQAVWPSWKNVFSNVNRFVPKFSFAKFFESGKQKFKSAFYRSKSYISRHKRPLAICATGFSVGPAVAASIGIFNAYKQNTANQENAKLKEEYKQKSKECIEEMRIFLTTRHYSSMHAFSELEEIAKKYQDYDIDVNQSIDNKEPLLVHYCTYGRDAEYAAGLLNQIKRHFPKTNIDTVCTHCNHTAYTLAVQNDNLKYARALINHDANPYVSISQDGKTIKDQCQENHDLQVKTFNEGISKNKDESTQNALRVLASTSRALIFTSKMEKLSQKTQPSSAGDRFDNMMSSMV